MLNSKHIVLVNEHDEILGTAEKLTAHNMDTPLHRGVSVFLFNTKRQLLIQKRHSNKKLGLIFGLIVFAVILRLMKLTNKQCIDMVNLS